MEKAIIIFTRIPVPGKTKTRMMPHLTPVQCAKLHRCFLQDILSECGNCGADIYVSYADDREEAKDREDTDAGKQLVSRMLNERAHTTVEIVGCAPQRGEGLGERMYNAVEETLQKGYSSCVLIGTDVPELKACHIEKSFRELEKRDIVFGGTRDGGYYLIGMRTPCKEAFELKSYGHGTVLHDTAAHLKETGYTVGYTETLQDMDTPGDLRDYRDRMRQIPELRATKTGKYLSKISKISVIIPVYNEEKTIDAMQRQLKDLQGKCEILFVDGGSTDRTLEKISPEFTVLHSKKGRANQMNLGAEKSTGDILFFLHCDSELPDRALLWIRKVMQSHRAGCFGIAFHSRNFFMFTCRIISNHRVKDRKVMFGDQGIFIDRNLFFEAGMFPDIPVMEDYQFSLTLKEMKVKLGIAGRRIYTSDRRFPKGTVPKLKLMWKMNRLRKMYRDGVPIETIADLYRDAR